MGDFASFFHFPFYFLSPWSEIIYSKRKRLNCKEILCIRKCLCILTYFHQLFSAISSNYKIKSKYEKLGKIIWPGEGFQIRFDFFCWSWTGFCFLFLDFSVAWLGWSTLYPVSVAPIKLCTSLPLIKPCKICCIQTKRRRLTATFCTVKHQKNLYVGRTLAIQLTKWPSIFYVSTVLSLISTVPRIFSIKTNKQKVFIVGTSRCNFWTIFLLSLPLLKFGK